MHIVSIYHIYAIYIYIYGAPWIRLLEHIPYISSIDDLLKPFLNSFCFVGRRIILQKESTDIREYRLIERSAAMLR